MADGSGSSILIPYAPRAVFQPFHARKQRWSLGVAHRRCGKTVARINELVRRCATCTKVEPRFAYIAPTFTQAKDIAWSYLVRFTAPIPGIEHNASELRCDLPNGGRIRLYGSENYERIRGLYLDGCVLDEFGLMDPRAWPEVIRPALADRRGWADFIGTPNGRNHFWDMYDEARQHPDDWQVSVLRASETGLLDPDELADARKMMTAEQYDQEFECSFEAAILGAYYGKEMAEAERSGRIGRVSCDPLLPVQTWWDLGYDDSTSIWFVQYAGSEIRVIDYYEASGESLPHYAKILDAKPYKYLDHVLPHDVEVHELGTGRSRRETLASLGLRSVKVIAAQDIMDGINAVRLLLPRCWFDADRCKRGIEALRQYRADWDEKTKALKTRPLHNWASHGADAFRTGANGAKAPGVERERKRPTASAGAWLG